MQNFISSLSLSKSFQFVNDQLCREEHSPYRHDCHDPPQGAAWGFRMTDPHRKDCRRWQGRTLGRLHRLEWDSQGTQPGGEDCLGCRVRPPEHGEGKDCLRKDWHGEDCHPEQEIVLSLVYGRPETHLQRRAFFSPQDNLASFRIMARASSWSARFNFLKVSTSLPSGEEGAAPVAKGTGSGSLSPSKNSWYVSISSAFANLSKVSKLGIVCPCSTLEI